MTTPAVTVPTWADRFRAAIKAVEWSPRVVGCCPECGHGPCCDDCLPPFTD